MEKYLLTIEFRYYDAPKSEDRDYAISETITIGVYDDFDDACLSGNALLENLESKFTIHVFPNGNEAKRERFSKNGGCFGGKNTLVTNLAYLKTPFEFYAKIQTLKYNDVNQTISEVLEACVRYVEYKKQQSK